MANLVITQRCGQACAFCFAPAAGASMPLAEIVALARGLREEGLRVAPLVGGEPTDHPDFAAAVAAIRALGLGLRVFSHGRMPRAARDALAALAPDVCEVVVNASATQRRDGRLHPEVLETLETLGPRALLGLTLDAPGRPYAAVTPLYARYGLAPRLRVGLAQPVAGGDNARWLDYRDPALGALICELAEAAHAAGVRTVYDCGFVLCSLTRDQRRALDRLGAPYRATCGAIPDVAAGGEAWPCMPLRRVYRARAGASPAGARRGFDALLRGWRAAGV